MSGTSDDDESVDAGRRALIRNALFAPPVAFGLVSLTGCSVDAKASTPQALAPSEDTVIPDSELPQFHISSQFEPGANLPTGTVNLYTDPALPVHTLIVVKGADNEATRLQGIDATGVNHGEIRVLLNWSESGQDCGQVVLKHRSSNVVATNQIICPGNDDYYIPINGGVMLVYGGIEVGQPLDSIRTPQWHVVDAAGWGKRAKVQSLNFYPNIELPTLSGTYDNSFNISGYSNIYSTGLAGGDMDLKSYTLVRIPVAPEGAVLTGLAPDSGTNGSESALGPVKILMNYGPGRLTLKHLSSGDEYGGGVTEPGHQFILPRGEDLELDQFESVMLVSTLGDPNPDSLWRVISIGRNDRYYDEIDVATTLTTKSEVLSPSVSAALPGFDSGVTHDFNPTDTSAIVRVVTDPSGSLLGGLAGQPLSPRGERRLLVVVGNGPLILVNEDFGSSNENRFDLPNAVPFVVPVRGSVWLTKDATDHWKPDATVGIAAALQLDITPDALPAGNVDDWNPVGAIGLNIGLGFAYANWIRAEGAVGGSVVRSLIPTIHGRRMMITNYGSAITFAYGIGTDNGGCPFYGAGSSYVLGAMATVWLTFDGLNNLWLVGT